MKGIMVSKQITTPLLICVDFDRTLSNESLIDETMERICSGAGLDVDAIRIAKQGVESRGDSFSTLDHLRQHYSPGVLEIVIRQFASIGQKTSVLYEDALPLLRTLRTRSVPHLILTQGPHEWQELKIMASKLDDFPYKIIAEKDKGKEIISWQSADGLYQVPIAGFAPARRIILIDDKVKSFTSLPSDCSGYLIRRPDEQILPSQSGTVPVNVAIIATLLEVVDKLSMYPVEQ